MIRPSERQPRGLSHVQGVKTPVDDKPQPITYVKAAALLARSPSTLRDWATRYAARRIGTVGRTTYLDYRDLAAIDGHIVRGEPVPPTPEARALARAQRLAAAAA